MEKGITDEKLQEIAKSVMFFKMNKMNCIYLYQKIINNKNKPPVKKGGLIIDDILTKNTHNVIL